MTYPARWIATIIYVTDSGPVDVRHECEELHEIHDLVERGPDWNAIEKIEIVMNPERREPLTVEEASEL